MKATKNYKIGDKIKLTPKVHGAIKERFRETQLMTAKIKEMLIDCQISEQDIWNDIHKLHPALKGRNLTFRHDESCVVVRG